MVGVGWIIEWEWTIMLNEQCTVGKAINFFVNDKTKLKCTEKLPINAKRWIDLHVKIVKFCPPLTLQTAVGK